MVVPQPSRRSRRTRQQPPEIVEDASSCQATRPVKKKRKTAKKHPTSIQAEANAADVLQESRNDATTPRKNDRSLLPSSSINTLATGSTKTKKNESNGDLSVGAKREPFCKFLSAETPACPSNVFCTLPPKQPVDYKKIADNLQHPAWKFDGNDLDVFPFKEQIIVGPKSHRKLTRNIQRCEQNGIPGALYFSDEHIDVFTQFTYRGENEGQGANPKEYLPTPCYLYRELQRDKFEFRKDTVAFRCLKHIGKEIFGFDCLDFTVHVDDEAHYSKAFVMNSFQVLDRASYKPFKSSDPMAVILIVDTLPTSSGGHHDPDVVARVLRRFLNKAEKQYGFGGGAAFNINTMPHKVLKIPQQERSWTCGAHSMIVSYLMRKFLKENGPITRGNIDEVEARLIHTAEEALVIREDLLKLLTMLRGEEYSASKLKMQAAAWIVLTMMEASNWIKPSNAKEANASGSARKKKSQLRTDFSDSSEDDEDDLYQGVSVSLQKNKNCKRVSKKQQEKATEVQTQKHHKDQFHRQPVKKTKGLAGNKKVDTKVQLNRKPLKKTKGLAGNKKVDTKSQSNDDRDDNTDDDLTQKKETVQMKKNKNRAIALDERKKAKDAAKKAHETSVARAQHEKERKAELQVKKKAEREEKKKAGGNEKESRSKKRIMGQAAASVKQVKDYPMRLALKGLHQKSTECNKMGSYNDESMNETMPRLQTISFCVDQIVAQPSKEKKTTRDETAFSCCGPSDQDEMNSLLELIYKNKDKVVLVKDAHHLDTRVCGPRRPVNTRSKKQTVESITTKHGNEDYFKNSRSTIDQMTPTPQKDRTRPKYRLNHSRLDALAESEKE